MTPAIRVESLSKLYRLGDGADGADYFTLRESLYKAAAKPWNWMRARMRRGPATGAGSAVAGANELWALKDVSFEVRPGEVLGILGRNGAGKSTLLKVLARITPPTAGAVAMRGRVGSLLEVGTGFHPELTGRENILLNGAILGMSRREIDRKFDQIVAFAETERFLDTPVKRYSSGMYTRLAFAVASHLDSEILIVDEVLAVGDAKFQRKCLGRMSDVSREGRTVLFVSHNVSAVRSLCTRGIVVEAGRISFEGRTEEAVNRYLDSGSEVARTGVIPDDAPRRSDVRGEARLKTVSLTDVDGNAATQLFFGQPFRVVVACEVMREIEDAHLEISVSTLDGTHVTYASNTDGGAEPWTLPIGRHEFTAEFDVTLLPREYTIDVGIHHHHNGATSDYVQRTLNFGVLKVARSGDDHYRWPATRGLVRAPSRWELDGVRREDEAVS